LQALARDEIDQARVTVAMKQTGSASQLQRQKLEFRRR